MATLKESTPLPWQKRAIAYALSKKFDVILLAGGYGSGKTAVNCHIMRLLATKQFRRGIVIGRAKTTLKDTIVKSIQDEIPKFLITKYNIAPEYYWELKSEDDRPSELLTKTMQYSHEADGQLRSINADFLWLIEATTLPEESYSVGISRLRQQGYGGYYPIIIETNPSSQGHWVYKNFIKDSKETFRTEDGHEWHTQKIIKYKDKDGNEKLSRILTINTSTYANPEYPLQIIAQAKETVSNTEFNRKYMGIWCAGEGRVWESYTSFPHPDNPALYARKYDRIFIGVDPGQEHPMAITFIGCAGGVYEVFDEFVGKNRSVRQAEHEIFQRFDTWGINKEDTFFLYIEPSGMGRAWMKEWEDRRNNISCFLAKSKGTDPSLGRAFKTDEMLRTKRLVINELCKSVIHDIEQATFEEGKVKEKIDKQAYDPHAMESVGYAISKEVL
jgi:PBSX family phage terminase large subunit